MTQMLTNERNEVLLAGKKSALYAEQQTFVHTKSRPNSCPGSCQVKLKSSLEL